MTTTRAVREPLDVKLDYVTFRMDVVNELAKAVASTVYEKEVGLSLRELRLMRFISRYPGLTVTRLIEQTHVEKTLTSKTLAALVRRDLVVREICEIDARQTNLYLTTQGARLVKTADSLGQKMEAGMMSVLSESDMAVFRRCLEALYDAHSTTQNMTDIYQKVLKLASTGQPPAKSAS